MFLIAAPIVRRNAGEVSDFTNWRLKGANKGMGALLTYKRILYDVRTYFYFTDPKELLK